MEKEIDATIHLFDKDDSCVSYPAGTVLFKSGQPRDYMYVVVEGQVDLYINGDHVETVEACGMFGEMALIEKDVRTATAIARTDCKLAIIDENRFSFLVEQTPFFALKMMRILAKRLRRMDRRIQE